MVRNLYLVLGTLYIVAGIITIFIVPSTLGFGVLALLAGISILFFFQAEIIRYFSDSHDANYMNLKVRIETLKVLEKISELNDNIYKLIINHPPDIIFVYSKRSAESFDELMKKYSLKGLMTDSKVMCISEKVLNVFKQNGWKRLEIFEAGEELTKLKK